jgi:alkylglycerol monooxygenase
MERYGQILLIAIPAFLTLVIIEKMYGWLRGEDRTPFMDMVSSLLSGMTNTVKDVLGLSISIISYGWLLSHLALFQLESQAWVYALTFIMLDFQAYWVHRWAHEINFFWNKHLIHHSSEEFNLACALRQSISSLVNLFTFFLIPAALLGIPALIVATIAPLHLFAQFWYHTRHIKRLGFLELFLVTPSHHRVHHAINPEYLDKNYSAIFIVWDKIFGTFQPELPHVPPVYGITRPVQTWNPIIINFQHLFLLIRDAWHTQGWVDKITIWWKPTGWRPADVARKFPVHHIENVYQFQKYGPVASVGLKSWTCAQLIAMIFFLVHFFGHLAEIGSPHIFIYGAFLFVSVYSIAEVMNKNPLAPWMESVRLLLGLGLFYYYQGWFGLASLEASPVLIFLCLSAGTAWILQRYDTPDADYHPTASS